ncbi:MAG: hypothetical protein R3B48_19890 [Kofleriaceae bacterium]
MENAVLIAMVWGVVAAGIVFDSRRERQRRAWLRRYMLVSLAELLGGKHDGEASAEGRVLGLPASVTFVTRGDGARARPWTTIEVALPYPYPLALHIRDHAPRDRRQIARGKMVDLDNSDPPFDRRFLVEAAPADVVRRALDAAARGYLMSQAEVELTTEPGPRPALRLAVQRWMESPDEAADALRMLGRLVSRVRDIYQELADAQQVVSGDPYRPMLDAGLARDAMTSREAEVARVDGLRQRRRDSK